MLRLPTVTRLVYGIRVSFDPSSLSSSVRSFQLREAHENPISSSLRPRHTAVIPTRALFGRTDLDRAAHYKCHVWVGVVGCSVPDKAEVVDIRHTREGNSTSLERAFEQQGNGDFKPNVIGGAMKDGSSPNRPIALQLAVSNRGPSRRVERRVFKIASNNVAEADLGSLKSSRSQIRKFPRAKGWSTRWYPRRPRGKRYQIFMVRISTDI